MYFFDTHTHFTLSKSFSPEESWNNGREVGVAYFLDPGLYLSDFPERWEKLSGLENVFFGLAVSPHNHKVYCHNEDLLRQDLAKMESEVISKNKNGKRVVAISEIGYDFFIFKDGYEWQEMLFDSQIDLAIKLDLPIFLHLRNDPDSPAHDAYQRAIDLIRKKNGRVRGAVHCFNGNNEHAKAFLDLGFYLSFSGVVSFKNSQIVREVVEYTPTDRMLSETDSPYLAPVPHRGKENQSAYLPLINAVLANLKKKRIEDLSEILTENAFSLLRIKDVVNI